MTPTRRTLASPAHAEGRGLFTNLPASVTLHPAEPGSGLNVSRAGEDPILVHISTLSDDVPHPAFQRLPPRCTTLGLNSGPLFTVEHALSALVGLGITDALLEVTGPELPILDGSAAPFVEAIRAAGLTELDASADPLVVTEELTIADDRGGSVRVTPADDTRYTYHLDYATADGSDFDEFSCECGAKNCRGKVTGNDWELQLSAESHRAASPYLLLRQGK